MIPLDDIDGPPLSPPDDTIPTRDCPECHEQMAYVEERNAWVCDDGCDGFIDDVDDDHEEDR